MTTTPNNPRTVADDERAFVHFLDLAGHDLRNPITVLKSQVQLLQRRLNRDGDRENDLHDLSRMAYQIERLTTGLDTYLEAARISQGRFFLVPDSVDLTALARRVVSIYGAASRAHTLSISAPDAPIVANWDPSRVELALSILLANALKYSSGGDVHVTVKQTKSDARVAVTDSGVGIPAGEEQAVFEEYAHGSNVENAGIGLGLFVAREILRRHGGTIGVDTPASGGASFWFTLPLAGLPAM
jgi:signal transduction histidine kinase